LSEADEIKQSVVEVSNNNDIKICKYTLEMKKEKRKRKKETDYYK